MTKEELILPYKLETHLYEICNNNSTYANLLSVWNINKKMCQDVLSNVVVNYPHYTKHDISHSEAIITNIEMLLGEDAIRNLSPTDTWLLLHSAYLHDLGMVIDYKKIEENWDSTEFQNYLHELENSSDDSLAENAKFINTLGDELCKKEKIVSWPLHVRNAVTLIVAEYYRRHHADDSNSYIKNLGKIFNVDLSCNGLIQQRLIMLLADIASLHTKSSEKILELDYRTNGFNADYAHPRFLVQMLRMGDLLDADNNRFNLSNEIVFGEIPESSMNHWEKHLSARHILITPDVIEYKADCSKIEVYRETRAFISWLKEEVDFWSLNWKNIMPENIMGSAPRLGKCELLLNGVPDIQGLSDLRFSISPEKAFEVIEGANIYEDQFVFIREVIQNSLDACKIQLWRDVTEGRYRSWIHCLNYDEMQPFDIDHQVFENYSIEVKVLDYDNEHIKVIVKDNGIGLSAEQFKKICNVGMSYSGDNKKKDEIANMPLWLRPTAGFGIGLQSIFLIAEEFEIYSKSSVDEGIYARVTSRRKNGYVQITNSNILKTQGTELHVIIPRDLDFKYGIFSNTQTYIDTDYDPFSEKKDLLYYKIWDILRDTIESTYFPIRLYFENALVHTIEAQNFDKFAKRPSNERYIFNQIEHNSMELWDKKSFTNFKISLHEEYQIYKNQYFFKGMELKNDLYFNPKGISFKVDFYGLDTKRTLTLDRKGIRKEVRKELINIVNSAIEFYLKNLEEVLFSNVDTDDKNVLDQIYIFWCIVELKKKFELNDKYPNIFDKIDVPISTLEKGENGEFSKSEINFIDILHNLDNIAFIHNLHKYINQSSFGEKVKIDLIAKILNQNSIQFKYIITDKIFSDIFDSENCSKIMIILHNSDKLSLVLYSKEESKIIKFIDDTTRRYYIKTLLCDEKMTPRTNLGRNYIAGIHEYESICTTKVPFGINGDWYHSSGFIISPFTIKQWRENNHLEIDEFIKQICSTYEFNELVKHVYLHPMEQEKYSLEQITNRYKDFIKDVYLILKNEL